MVIDFIYYFHISLCWLIIYRFHAGSTPTTTSAENNRDITFILKMPEDFDFYYTLYIRYAISRKYFEIKMLRASR